MVKFFRYYYSMVHAMENINAVTPQVSHSRNNQCRIPGMSQPERRLNSSSFSSSIESRDGYRLLIFISRKPEQIQTKWSIHFYLNRSQTILLIFEFIRWNTKMTQRNVDWDARFVSFNEKSTWCIVFNFLWLQFKMSCAVKVHPTIEVAENVGLQYDATVPLRENVWLGNVRM